MSPAPPFALQLSADDIHARARRKARRAPSWLLRRRERRIVAAGFPTGAQLIDLGAIRHELWLRSLPRGPRR